MLHQFLFINMDEGVDIIMGEAEAVVVAVVVVVVVVDITLGIEEILINLKIRKTTLTTRSWLIQKH